MTSLPSTRRRRSSSQDEATTGLLDQLRQRIRSGQYPVGEWLPPERDLADEFGMSRRAVRRAIECLADEGLVRCRPRFRPVVEIAGEVSAAKTDAIATTPSASRLVALVMWHGDPGEQGATAQQRIFWGMNRRLAEDGYHGIFLDLGEKVRTEPENAEREATHLRYALDQEFAGVVFYAYAYRDNRELIQEVARRMPLILIDRQMMGVQADFVGIDNRGAMFEMTRHLLTQGHRRMVYITTAEPINTVQDRLTGYRQAIAESPDSPLAENVLTWLMDAQAPEWPVFDNFFRLEPGQRPTAVLCVNDYIASQIYRRLLDLGFRVPEEVALTGFDDIVQTLPGGVGLTTVAQPFEQIGHAAAEAFLTRRTALESNDLTYVELPARLVMRTSTAAQR